MTSFRPSDVFTPSDFPLLTYVARDDKRLEGRLRDALDTPGEIVSLSGPSKSGKTVLVECVVGEDDLIVVTGAGLTSGDMLWDRVLNWMGSPTQVTSDSGTEYGGNITAGGTAKTGIPLLAEGSVTGKASVSGSKSSGEGTVHRRRGMQQVVEEISNSSFVLLIDDFHYMHRPVQTEISREIKEAARQGVKICTASVPHRSDDVVRSNPELRGRIRAIDSDYWDRPPLLEIGRIGFPLLNVTIDDDGCSQRGNVVSWVIG